MTLASMNHATFAPYLNAKFQVSSEDGATVELEMVETFELTDAPNQERFSLIFRGGLERILGQGTYRFTHAELGDIDIFIVPIRQDADSRYYEAAFNRKS